MCSFSLHLKKRFWSYMYLGVCPKIEYGRHFHGNQPREKKMFGFFLHIFHTDHNKYTMKWLGWKMSKTIKPLKNERLKQQWPPHLCHVAGSQRGGRALLNSWFSLDKRLCSKHTIIDPDRPMAEFISRATFTMTNVTQGKPRRRRFHAGYRGWRRSGHVISVALTPVEISKI